MRLIITLLLTICLSEIAKAQPRYSTRIQEIEKGRKSNHYSARASYYQKRGEFNDAVYHAAFALSIANTNRHFSKAQETLSETYERTIQLNLSRIQTLESQTSLFESDQTVTDIAEIVRLYKYMVSYNSILKSLPPKSFKGKKRKDPDLTFTIEDFAAKLRQAQDRLEAAKEEAANMHYRKGLDLMRFDDISHNKEAYQHFIWASQYIPNYKDTKIKLSEAQEKATTRMGVVKFDNRTGLGSEYNHLSESLTDEVISGMFNSVRSLNLSFFEMISRDELERIIEEQKLSVSGLLDDNTTVEVGMIKGVHVLLLGKITTATVNTSNADPMVRNVAREIVVGTEKYKDEEGKERTRDVKKVVRATYTVYTKRAVAQIRGSYRIVEVETGKIIESGTSEGEHVWSESWARSSGDRRALSDAQTKQIAKKEPNYPSKHSLIVEASHDLARKLSGSAMSYAMKVGR